jgi:hypothetical protein
MTDFETVSNVICKRRTTKVFAEDGREVDFPDDLRSRCDGRVRESIATAGWAPFHFDRKTDGIAEPWRVNVLWKPACRELSIQLPQWAPDLKPANKLPALLNACGAAVLVDWLPVSASEVVDEVKRSEMNNEHLAATAAYVQNLLLLLTACDLETYWSSAFLLGSPTVRAKLGLSPSAKLLAGVFVSYHPTQNEDLTRAPGGNRVRRSAVTNWTTEVESLAGLA